MSCNDPVTLADPYDLLKLYRATTNRAEFAAAVHDAYSIGTDEDVTFVLAAWQLIDACSDMME